MYPSSFILFNEKCSKTWPNFSDISTSKSIIKYGQSSLLKQKLFICFVKKSVLPSSTGIKL